MPLRSGSSRKAVSSNIKELVDTYKSKGKIGSSKPASKSAAVKQAVAISLKKAGVSRMATGGMAERRQSAAAEGRKDYIRGPEDKTGTSITTRKQIAAIKKKGGTITYKRDGKLPVGVY